MKRIKINCIWIVREDREAGFSLGARLKRSQNESRATLSAGRKQIVLRASLQNNLISK